LSNKWIRYLLAIVSPAALLGCALVFNLLTLEAVGEYSSVDRIVREQRDTGGLYNGYVHSVASYKNSGYRQAKPEVVVIGSSRSLQVRDYFFKAKFFNAGGEVRSPAEAFAVTDELLRWHKPQHIVWFMDFPQFCASSRNFRENLQRPVSAPRKEEMRVQRELVPFQLIAVKKVVSLGDFLNWGTGSAEKVRRGVRILGLGVQKNLDAALGPDGSLYRFLDGGAPSPGKRLDFGLTEIEQGSSVWKHDYHLNREALQLVDLFVGEMERAGINLTLIAAPLPEFMLKAMLESGRYTYLTDWRERMKTRYPGFYDYTSVGSIAGQDCEFLDYYHGGEVTYMRILAEIGARGKAALRKVVNTGRLKTLILRRAGDLTVADNSIGTKLLGARPPIRDCRYAPPTR
jgi:hypothetical protein